MTDPIRSIVVGVAALHPDDPHGSDREDPALASAAALARSAVARNTRESGHHRATLTVARVQSASRRF